MIKLFVSDIDGTMLNEKHALNDTVKNAVKKMREKGVHFMPCSGRDHDSLLKVIDGIEVPKCICLNGAEYRNNEGEVLARFPLSQEVSERVMGIIQKYHLDVLYFYENGKYTLTDRKAILDTFIRCSKAFDEGGDSEFNEKDVFFTTIQHVDSFEDILRHEICKIEILFEDKKTKEEVCAQLAQLDGILLTHSHSFNVEVNDMLANKGNMVAKVMELYGYQDDEVLVIGDGHNDISMLSRFPNSVAMGQAAEEVKQAAHYITLPNSEDGIVAVVEKVMAERES